MKVDRISLLNWIKNYFAILLWVSNWFCKEQIMIISFLVLRASWLWNASIQHDATEWRPWILSEKTLNFSCGMCPSVFKTLDEKKMHNLHHFVPCTMCRMTLRSRDHLLNHLRKVHNQTDLTRVKNVLNNHGNWYYGDLRAGVKDICVLLS